MASDAAQKTLKQATINQFILQGDGSIRNCCLAECNQLINLKSEAITENACYDDNEVEEGDDNDNGGGGGGGGGKIGGVAVYCDQCSISYCFDCSSKLQRTMSLHPGMSCLKSQSRYAKGIRDHVRYITDDILCLKCPGWMFTRFS